MNFYQLLNVGKALPSLLSKANFVYFTKIQQNELLELSKYLFFQSCF